MDTDNDTRRLPFLVAISAKMVVTAIGIAGLLIALSLAQTGAVLSVIVALQYGNLMVLLTLLLLMIRALHAARSPSRHATHERLPE
jgi:uncharacterized membrane protein YhaH (DUF805 family)